MQSLAWLDLPPLTTGSGTASGSTFHFGKNTHARIHAHTRTRTHPWARARAHVDAHACTRGDNLNDTRAHASYPHWSTNCLRRRAITLRRSRRLCAASGTTASRWSRIGHWHIDGPLEHAHAHRCRPIPMISKQPASSHRRSPTLSQTVRGSQHTPAAVSPPSKSAASTARELERR